MNDIGIVILHPQYVISWSDTNIISELAEDFSITIFGPKNIIEFSKSKNLNNKSINFVEIPMPKISIVDRTHFFLSLILAKRKNPSFKFRIRNLIFSERKLVPKPFNCRIFSISLLHNIRHTTKYLVNYWYQLPAFIPFINFFLNRIFKFLYYKSEKLFPSALDTRFKLVIFLGGGNELEIFNLIKSCNDLKIKTALCLENWDNLTSKRSIIVHPDYLLVMGEESAKLAAEIHDIPLNRVVPAGLPRFNPFRSKFKEKVLEDKSKFTILYLGCYQPHNEIKLLNALIELLDYSILKDEYRLIYKPHPGPRKRYTDDNHLNSRVHKVLSNLEVDRTNPVIDDSHISLIQDANIIISTPTSMVLECMMLGKKVVLDTTNDGVHRTSAFHQYRNYVHFRSLDKINDLVKCYSLLELQKEIITEYKFPTKSLIKYDLSKIIENDLESYSCHIKSLTI
jgi:hypothetical protein